MHEPDIQKLIKTLKPDDLVLDVGGWHAPLNRANFIIDIMPYESRNREGALFRDIWPKELFSSQTYVQRDLCSPSPWPFKDKQFDFVFCSNTLEDLRDPIHVCREMVRAGKAGYIEVPSRLAESTRGVERPFYCGYYHHRWLCERENEILSFMFKPAMLHSYRRFHFLKPWHKKMNPLYASMGFFWNDSFNFTEKIIIDRDEVQKDLLLFRKKFLNCKDLYIQKFSWTGKRV